MANVVKALKAEIARTSRKVATGATQGIGETNPNLRRLVADLRRRVFVLERENKRLITTVSSLVKKLAERANVERHS